MSEVHITGVIKPAEGKTDRVREFLLRMAKEVEAKEPGALQYRIFEHVDAESGRTLFVAHETYTDLAARDAHFQTPYFREMEEAMGSESLIDGPPDLKYCKPLAGYESK